MPKYTTDQPPKPLQLRRFPVPLTIGLYDGQFLCDLTLAEEERVQSRLTVVVDSNTGQVSSRGRPLIDVRAREACNLFRCVPLTLTHAHTRQICSIQKAGGPGMSKEQLATALTLCGARLQQVAQAQAQAQQEPQRPV